MFWILVRESARTPVNGGAILGKGGPDPQGGNKERQLSPDEEREKT
jgi:hypothetical protein